MKTPIFFQRNFYINKRKREGKLLEYKIEVNKAQTTAQKIGEKVRPKKWIIQ